MHEASVAEGIRLKFLALEPVMDERMRRQWAASEATLLSWGGVSLVATATGMSRSTIQTGVKELKERQRTGITGWWEQTVDADGSEYPTGIGGIGCS